MPLFKNITCNSYCNILIDKSNYTYNRERSLGEIIDLAIELKCPIITKNGKGASWELKGKGLSYDYLKQQIKINTNHDIFSYDVLCILIEF
jgi:hypothetical protein